MGKKCILYLRVCPMHAIGLDTFIHFLFPELKGWPNTCVPEIFSISDNFSQVLKAIYRQHIMKKV